MANMIKRVEVKKLFGNTDIEWELNKTNVLVGKNGMGKSTILQLIINSISQESIFDNSDLCSDFILKMESIQDNMIIKYNALLQKKREIEKLKDELKKFNEFINDNYTEGNESKNHINKKIINKFIKMDKIINMNIDNIFDSKSEHALSKKINYEFISTININANSLQNIAMSNGVTTNVLDWEIQSELNRLLAIKDDTLNNKLLISLNEMFKESNKTVYFNQENLEFLFKNNKLSFTNLSSGERQVIYILLKVAIATKDNALILMDEPEISLHLSWQEKLLKQIRTINPDSQLIIVTHSPAIVMNGWLDSFVDIQDITRGDSNV